MSAAFSKTISLLLLIVIGYLFQKKIRSKEQLDGIKIIILSLALPATILIALLQINFQSDLIIVPIMSLGFNIIMYLLIDKLPLQPVFNIPLNQYRTLIMLIPSLAPGLSCFPFIIEYSGTSSLAMAALADVGNKIFVLIISYTIAMKWYYEINKKRVAQSDLKIKDMLMQMIREPVNIVMILALIMLAFGLTYETFPDAISLSIDKLSLLMTPLILVFVGLSMRLTWDQVKTIFSFLFFRSSIAFAISGLILFFFPVTDVSSVLLIIVFPQSACSFWPYAHMALVGQMENKIGGESKLKTFDLDFAMNVLACSMPFSVVLIMIIYAFGSLFANLNAVASASGIMFIASLSFIFFTTRIASTFKSNNYKVSSKL